MGVAHTAFCRVTPNLDWPACRTLIEDHQSWALVLLFLLIGIESAGVPLARRDRARRVRGPRLAGEAEHRRRDRGRLGGGDHRRQLRLLDRQKGWARSCSSAGRSSSRHAQKVLPRAERIFAKHGGKTVFFGRFIAILRITAAWMAGISHMPWWRFLLFNAAGGILWATAVGLVAYFAGSAAADAIQTYGLYAGGGHRRRHRRCRARCALVGAAHAGGKPNRLRLPWPAGWVACSLGMVARRPDGGRRSGDGARGVVCAVREHGQRPRDDLRRLGRRGARLRHGREAVPRHRARRELGAQGLPPARPAQLPVPGRAAADRARRRPVARRTARSGRSP